MGDTFNLLAKTEIENIEHECTKQGCDTRLPYQEVTRHKEKEVSRVINHHKCCPGYR